MKKFLVVVCALAMLFAMCACGAEEEVDPNAGVYDAISAEMYGIKIAVDDVFEDGFSIELQNGGKAIFHYDGEDYSLKWTLDGETFHAEGGGAELDGTLKDGVMDLEDVIGSGIQIRLVDSSKVSAEDIEAFNSDVVSVDEAVDAVAEVEGEAESGEAESPAVESESPVDGEATNEAEAPANQG